MKTAVLLTVVSVCLWPNIVVAQNATDTSESWRIEEIVITDQRPGYTATDTSGATRTPTPLEKVPQSVQVLNATLIEEQDLQTLTDALVNVSGVVPSRTLELLTREKIIRGFDAATFFDGLPAYGLTPVADPTTLVNVERIEVLKGPSATLFSGGSGAPLAGLVNIVSKLPTAELAASASARVGSFETRSVEGDLNLPLLGDAVLFRVTGDWSEAGSHIDDLDSESWTLYPTLTWGITSDTLLTLRGQFGKLDQLEYSGLPASITSARALSIDPEEFTGARDAPKSTIDNTFITATLDHRFGDTLSASLSVRRYDSRFQEFGTTPFPLIATSSPTTFLFASAELPTDVEQTFFSGSLLWEFTAGGATHRMLSGVDVDDTNYEARLGFGFIGELDYANGDDAPFVRPVLTDLQRDALQTTAAFLQDQIGIGEKLDVTVGLRWTRLEIESTYQSSGLTFVDTSETEQRLTPRIGATYQISDGINLFAGYSEGFQGLVAAFGVTDPQPEESRAYDMGVHFAAPVPGLSGTVSLYQITRENVVTADPANPFASIQAGEQRARGLEIDLVYEPTPAFSLLASYGYTDAEITDDNVLPEGDHPARVPEHAGRLAGRYRFQHGALEGLELGAGVTYTGERPLTLPNAVEADAVTLVDAQAAYDFGPVALSLSIVNLFDADDFEPFAYLDRAVVIPTQPRSAFVTLRGGL